MQTIPLGRIWPLLLAALPPGVGAADMAKVQRIGARVDPVSQSVKLSAVIDGKFNELIAGMSGKVLMAPPAGQ